MSKGLEDLKFKSQKNKYMYLYLYQLILSYKI